MKDDLAPEDQWKIAITADHGIRAEEGRYAGRLASRDAFLKCRRSRNVEFGPELRIAPLEVKRCSHAGQVMNTINRASQAQDLT